MPSGEIGTVDFELPEQSSRLQPPAASGFLARPVGWACCLAVLLAIALVRIVSTYHVFNHTIDEPSHIAGGIEWWEKGTYTLETKHTPLARISVGLGPYLAGARGTGATRWQDTYPVLSQNGNYWHLLTLGRIGVLPYFVIATLVLFFWTRRLFGWPTALLAVGVFTQLPTILAHSSNATTDIALTAMFCWSAYAFTLWLRQPNVRTGAHFGITAGLALCTKLSTLVFLPVYAAPVLAMYAVSKRTSWRLLLRTLVIVAVCAFFSLWAVYRFSHAPLTQVTHLPDRVAGKFFSPSSALTRVVHEFASHVPVPAPEFWDGIRMLRDQNREGTTGYLFGRVKDGGWWYFFFAALALKTPIAVLLLATLGSVLTLRGYWNDRKNWEIAAPLVAFVMIMLASTPARLDSGVRYVLPVFLFLSMLAAFGLSSLWSSDRQRLLSRAVAVALLVWLAASSARSHPDYLAYFNEFGGRDPSHMIVVGDLDWGQDLARLSTYLHERPIRHISLALDTFFVPESLGFPETELIKCHGEKPSGWVAVELRRERLHSDCYPWLSQQHAVTTVGKTMTIYYVQ